MKKNRKKIILLMILILFVFFGIFIASFLGYRNVLTSSPTGIIFHKHSFILFYDLGKKRWTPSEQHVQKAEFILTQCIQQRMLSSEGDEIDQEKIDFIYEHLNDYKRQYFGITEYGSKKMWIQLFLDEDNDFPGWKDSELMVNDGGESFFNTKINLEAQGCEDFSINGRG